MGKEKEEGKGHCIIDEKKNNTGGMAVKGEGKGDFKRKLKKEQRFKDLSTGESRRVWKENEKCPGA